jgi:predicted metalloprotease with PDZ domain
MEQRAPGGPFFAASYHDLVDMPLFIGRFDLDSMDIEGARHRLASYPAGQFHRAGRTELWAQIRGFMPVLGRVFGETPFPRYTTLLIFEPSYGGGSALEHQNSHVGIYHPQFMGTGLLASITAHEIVHAWNVKRLRPADLVPYRYDAPQPTPLLWVSEGITDYYADLALVRAGIIDSLVFLNITNGKREQVEQAPPVALEDASLTAWIHPTDGTDAIYYDKGSLAGLLLDILIRDASDNRRSLDDVMQGLYRSTYRQGKGFTTEEWWAAVSAAAGGRSFAEFAERYIDGREPFPWAAVGALAGIRLVADSTRDVRLGVNTIADSATVIVTGITPGSAAEAAGILAGDRLVKVGEIDVEGDEWAPAMRMRYADAEGQTITVVVLRDGTERRLALRIRKELTVVTTLDYDPAASAKAARVRNGILTGSTGNR